MAGEKAGANDIAIVGMSARFPGCSDVEEFWRALRDGVECIKTYSDEELVRAGVGRAVLDNPTYVKSGGDLDLMEYFDAGFFGFSPKDAGIMDPQHRNFYECSWEAFENAGHTPRQFEGAIGVFAGCGPNIYFMRNIMTNPDLVRSVGFFLLRHTGNDRDFLPTGISYKLNLQGPSVAVQTACSTSLVAAHMACQSLLSGECDMALAGGVTINIPHRHGYFYRENEVHSPDGHCRAFDARSAGTVITSGVGVVLLRRLDEALADGDTVHAVIRGSAINNDGARKVGYLAPSVDGHAAVVAEALALAGLSANDISYLETHGTGTSVGDPIEIAALTEAFRRGTDRKQFCPIGSVKASIGHTDTAAGVASLIKVVQSLKHRQIPASINYTSPNPHIDFENSPFFVNDQLREWKADGKRRRAGVSSLGVGGTNAHVVVEEAPPAKPSSPARSCELLVFSAKTPTALEAMSKNYAAFFREHPDVNFSDVAHTLQVGREAFEYRGVLAARNFEDAAKALASSDPQRFITGKAHASASSLVFMFPGGGAQYPNMGRELYASEPVYRDAVDECLKLVAPHIDFDLRASIFPAKGEDESAKARLREVTASTTSIFITSYATARLWMSKGYVPDAMTGHSLGEYVAACLGGVFSLADALAIVALRARLLRRLPAASMLSVSLPEAELGAELDGDLEISALNGPALCLVCGPDEEIDRLAEKLEKREIDCRKLHIAAVSHCRLIEPILADFLAGLKGIRLNPPERRFICNVTGTWARPDDVTNPEYWARHFRQPVRFSQGLGELLKDPNRVLLEVGPGSTMCSLARQQKSKPVGIVSSLRHPTEEVSDVQHFLAAIGRMWLAGVGMDWRGLRGDESRHRVPLPTYPFERQRYWIEPGQALASEEPTKPRAAIRKIENMDDWFFRLGWKPSDIREKADSEGGVSLIFADASGLGSEIAERLRAKGRETIVVREGDSYYKFSENEYALAPEEGRAGYDSLLADLAKHKRLPSRIAHCWMVTEGNSFRAGSNFFHRNQERGYYSLVFLMKALGDQDHQDSLHIDVVSNGMQAVGGEAVLYPDKATLLGPVRVIPHEFANVSIRSIDIELHDGSKRGKVPDEPLAVVADRVVEECLASPANEIIAHRSGTRYAESVESAALDPMGASRFRNGGVYLITGGLGGIGLTIAEHLATNYKANLILLGRSELPPRDEWDNWLQSRSARDRTNRRIRTVRRLEELGAAVMPAAADAANIEQMQDVIAKARDRFGTINGVIHAAAILEDGVIQAKSVESMERVFTSKVHGTLVLTDLLKDIDLDFFVLFSSTSSVLGPAGQVDYTAANCFLNALAQSDTGRDQKLVAIDWGIWKNVGVGQEIARRMRGEEVEGDYLHQRTAHPLLHEYLKKDLNEIVFSTELRVAGQWLLEEHRTSAGQALVPGTGYLEIVRAAFEEAASESNIEIRDLSFLAPLDVEGGEAKEMRVSLKRENDGYAFEVISRSVDGRKGAWTTNAIGTVRASTKRVERTIDIYEIASRCSRAGDTRDFAQKGLMSFGPRWDVVKTACFAENEALANLELGEAFSGDLDNYKLHPALLDLATGFALPLIAGYGESSSLFVPLSYGSVNVAAPLPRRIVSHVTHDRTRSTDDIAVFDIVVLDQSGKTLVTIDKFTMKKIANAAGFGKPRPDDSASGRSAHLTEGEKVFLETIECGILAEEGMRALERVVANHQGNPTLVSSIDLPALIERESEMQDEPDESGVKFDRPTLQSRYEAPRDTIETTLAEYWADLLGVREIGINDEFFELGGHSLIAVRLFAKIKKKWGVEYPISVLFQAPTIARCADMLRDELGIKIGDEQPSATKKGKAAFSLLVPMARSYGSDKPPFFLVAGMFGNVLNLRHLAAHLGEDQTVYALQARGLHGDEKPHTRFEDMARDYLKEVREAQPDGPYFLGGFSGGGIVAYEMAHQLMAAGERIGVLVMLDSIPARIPTAGKKDRLQIQLVRLREEGVKYPIVWAKQRFEWETRHLRKKERELTPAEFRSEEIEAGFREACDHYTHKPYPGVIDLFRPPMQARYTLGEGRLLNEHRQYLDHANHWEQYVQGGINVHIVTGDHDSMVLEPHVRVLARELKACLNKAQKRSLAENVPSQSAVHAAAAE